MRIKIINDLTPSKITTFSQIIATSRLLFNQKTTQKSVELLIELMRDECKDDLVMHQNAI